MHQEPQPQKPTFFSTPRHSGSHEKERAEGGRGSGIWSKKRLLDGTKEAGIPPSTPGDVLIEIPRERGPGGAKKKPLPFTWLRRLIIYNLHMCCFRAKKKGASA